MKTCLILIMAFAGLAAPAVAADPSRFTGDENTPQFDWSGFYAGVFGGYGSSTSNQSYDGGPDFVVNGGGGTLGGDVGANIQLGDNFILGGEADMAWGNINGNTTIDGGLYSANIGWLGSLTAKLGFTVDRLMIYADAGGALAGFDQSDRDTPADDFGTANFETVAAGWTAGAGAAYALTDNLSANVKYSYYSLGSRDYNVVNTVPGFWGAHSADLTAQSITAGLNYKF